MKTELFQTVEVTTDLLILGGGMAACGAAYEAAYWAKKHNLKVTVVISPLSREMRLNSLNLFMG